MTTGYQHLNAHERITVMLMRNSRALRAPSPARSRCTPTHLAFAAPTCRTNPHVRKAALLLDARAGVHGVNCNEMGLFLNTSVRNCEQVFHRIRSRGDCGVMRALWQGSGWAP